MVFNIKCEIFEYVIFFVKGWVVQGTYYIV